MVSTAIGGQHEPRQRTFRTAAFETGDDVNNLHDFSELNSLAHLNMHNISAAIIADHLLRQLAQLPAQFAVFNQSLQRSRHFLNIAWFD